MPLARTPTPSQKFHTLVHRAKAQFPSAMTAAADIATPLAVRTLQVPLRTATARHRLFPRRVAAAPQQPAPEYFQSPATPAPNPPNLRCGTGPSTEYFPMLRTSANPPAYTARTRSNPA